MPALFSAIIVKFAVPVKLMFETVTILPVKSKEIGVSPCTTEIFCWPVTFSTVALIEALQS